MAKTDKAERSDGGLPVTYPREQLHSDVRTLLLHHARVAGFMMSAEAGWAMLSKTPPARVLDLIDPEEGDEELLSYAAIRDTPFARAMETMYDFAYFGVLDGSAEPMTYESIYMWVAAFLSDMSDSATLSEWSTYCETGPVIGFRCYKVAELANARLVLEGREAFYYFSSGKSDDDSVAVVESALTVRQMALLAGMEEMSIRAAANPKRATPLTTYTDEEGRTRIAIEVAKEWLKAKGRYVPVTTRYSRGDIDLAKQKFAAVFELVDALQARYVSLALRDGAGERLDAAVQRLGITVSRGVDHPYIELSTAHLKNVGLLRSLGEVLELSPDLLVLRAKEVLAREELHQVERELRAIESR